MLNAEGVIDKGTIFDQLDSYVPSSPFFAGGKRIGRGNGIIMEKRSLDDAWVFKLKT